MREVEHYLARHVSQRVQGGISINGTLFGIGIALGVLNMKYPKSLRNNIIRRIAFIAAGVYTALMLDQRFLQLSAAHFLFATLLGLGFMAIQLAIGGGIKLQKGDVTPGLLMTSLLLYLVELPGEEFLYRLAILLPARELFGPLWALLISTLMFLVLHIRTWDKSKIWIGSAILGLSCGIIALLTNSVFAAVIVHNLNNFAFLTLIGKRDLFGYTPPTNSLL